MTGKNVIISKNICKSFIDKRSKKEIVALENINIAIPHGRLTALVGPDGAGKTTFIRMVCGLLVPSCGSLEVLGMDVLAEPQAVQDRISYMPQQFGLYEDLTVMENMVLYADLHNVPPGERQARFAKLLHMTGLAQFTERLAGKLSGGMKQKLGLACTLVRAPELLVLDEPTVGVDPLSRRELWEILQQLVKDDELTVLVSTAYMDEADLCSKVIIFNEGKLLAEDTPENLRGYLHPPKGVAFTGVRSLPDKFVIEVRNLVRKFGDFVAVDDVSFRVREGEIFGLLGPNGAGKTTTFRMLCGLLPASSGYLAVAGLDLRTARTQARANIGYVAQKFSLYPTLTVDENMNFYGGVYGLDDERLRERMTAVKEQFNLAELSDKEAGELPGGYKQRLSMAVALLHEPRIIFLDEPTSGIDPVARRNFWKQITALAAEGKTIIITTHFMEEAEYCDRIMIQDQGRMLALGTPKEIREQAGVASDDMNEAFIAIVEKSRGEKEV
ncbi:MAG: ABC transporter ATP-binding protein [Phascolarctobacterium sp.]|nr:ABC transporter ATP-binding protein [Phascolarctobacterium sp.]